MNCSTGFFQSNFMSKNIFKEKLFVFRNVVSRLFSLNLYNIHIDEFLIESSSSNHALENCIFLKNYLAHDFFISFLYDNVFFNRFIGMIFLNSFIKFENSNASILSTILKQKISDNLLLKQSLIIFVGMIDIIIIKYSIFKNHATINKGAVRIKLFYFLIFI